VLHLRAVWAKRQHRRATRPNLGSWELDRLCAMAASLDRRVEVILVPLGKRAVVSFEPA
jgi:hypothetical protein